MSSKLYIIYIKYLILVKVHIIAFNILTLLALILGNVAGALEVI